jgi:dynein heavy chain 1
MSHRSVLRLLIKNKVANNKDFEWLRQMRFYYDPKQVS